MFDITIHKEFVEELLVSETLVYDCEIELNGKIVGYLNFEDTGGDIIIGNFYIFEEYRNRGIGTEVLHQFISEYYSVTLAPNNEDALRLYERLGFEEVEVNAPEIEQGFGVWRIN